MHDKQVRRRRAVLGLLVGASLILLTAYFGESAASPLHSVQRGIVALLSPIQQGASTILTPLAMPSKRHWPSTQTIPLRRMAYARPRPQRPWKELSGCLVGDASSSFYFGPRRS